MYNELLWLLLIVITFALLWGIKMLFGIQGLYVWSAVSIITANVLVVMTISLFGLTATLGNALYGSNFAVTDGLCELSGKKAARRAVWIGLYAQIAFTILINVALRFMPAQTDFANPHLQILFALLPRITVASLVAYVVSQFHDVWLYGKIAARFTHRSQLWIRNNLSTITSQCIDTIIFCSIAFIGVFAFPVVIQIAITTYIFKCIVALCDTPFVYLLTRKGSAR